MTMAAFGKVESKGILPQVCVRAELQKDSWATVG